MEDLKQIQEFFSNPVNENSRLRKQSILIEPAEIKYTESFGTGIKAPGVLHKANAGVFLGAEGAYIIVLPGGTFYVDGDTETAMSIWPLKDQDQALHRALDFTPFAPKYEEWKNWIKRPETVEEVDRYSGFNRNPEDPDSEKFEPTGSVSEFKEDLRALFGKFKGDLKNPEFIKGVAQIMVNWKSLLRSQLDGVDESVSEYNAGIYYTPDTEEKTKDAAKTGIEKIKDMIKKITTEADLNDPVAMKMRAAKMKADKLAKMRAANAGDDGNDKFFEKSTARLRKLKALKDKRAQIMRDMEQEAELEGGSVADKYGDMLNKLDKAISMLEGVKTPVNEYDVYMPSQEEVDQFFEKETHLQTHYLNAKPVMGQEGSFNKTEIQPWDEYDYSNWKSLVKKSLKEVQKGHGEKVSKEVFAKLKGKTISYKGEDYKVADVDDATLKLQDEKGKYKTINFNQFNIDGLIREIMETIELGKQLEEGKLCKKGEAYRKRRMAAGEKSSAYLSGRAVKVCKGQMSGKKKKKKK